MLDTRIYPLVQVCHINLKGRGVFALKDYEKGEIIEQCHVIVLDESDTEKISQTKLGDYCYTWGKDNTGSAIVLGNGSLYNHSYQPNAVYEKDIDNAILTIRCYLPIKAQEEITINYNGNPSDITCVWFEVIEKS